VTPVADHADVRSLPAGRAADERVHKAVFGVPADGNVPPYSTDDALASKVAKRLHELGFGRLSIMGEAPDRWQVYVYRLRADSEYGTYVAHSPVERSMALAVSKAALLAVEVVKP
jgi:hypothetical protein